MNVNGKYLKDEQENVISPITSMDSVYDKTGNNLETYLNTLPHSYYQEPNVLVPFVDGYKVVFFTYGNLCTILVIDLIPQNNISSGTAIMSGFPEYDNSISGNIIFMLHRLYQTNQPDVVTRVLLTSDGTLKVLYDTLYYLSGVQYYGQITYIMKT